MLSSFDKIKFTFSAAYTKHQWVVYALLIKGEGTQKNENYVGRQQKFPQI